MTTEESRTIEDELRAMAGGYLSGDVSFSDLYRLSGDVVPGAVARGERTAAWLAGGVIACTVEEDGRSGFALDEFRRKWVSDLFSTQAIHVEASDD